MSRDLVDALVASVLDRPDVQAALAVRDAQGRHVARRAVELAALVLEDEDANAGSVADAASKPTAS